MTTATAPAPAESSPANNPPEAPGAETITVPEMPKGASLVIYVYQAPTQFELAARCTAGEKVHRVTGNFPDRRAAIGHALQEAAKFFQKNRKAIKALEAYFADLKAEDAPPAAKPAPKREQLPPLPAGTFEVLDVATIRRNPENHRKTFDPAALKDLADSIGQHGLLQPIAVRELSTDEASAGQTHELILGERRWRAHVALKREKIDAKVYRGVTRAQAKAAALVENLQRQDIHPIEEAEGYRDLMQTEGITQEQVAQRVNRSRPVVANALRVLTLPDKVVDFIREKKLTMAHGVTLARFARWPKAALVIAEKTIEHDWSAGDLERSELPFVYQLAEAGLGEVIDRWRYTLPPDLAKDPDFVATKHGSSFCFAPEKWAPEKAKQDAARDKREAKRAGKSTGAGSSGKAGKLSAAEKAKRAAVILENRKARAESKHGLKAALLHLEGIKAPDAALCAIVARAALVSHHSLCNDLKALAAVLKITLPKGFSASYVDLDDLVKLAPLDCLRLAAAALVHREGTQGESFAWGIKNGLEQIACLLGSAGAKAVQKAAADELLANAKPKPAAAPKPKAKAKTKAAQPAKKGATRKAA